ncbi:HlyD family type I secretion periplasmic adaptor subunit [Desulfovibrio sp. JC010]|uniref:HlyD family type I secretion periplasmic adaptor subunit n=1 Tax=Desulfovibrio sp. JC010 TaxID=2593641 RepID=UPI0013D0DA05|nr:HlyD family type I secretion periplasmic adaptor subunit [Desulfovibrio sp. JC010]NDV25383.1 HlyD family type I secretion periplasmic adaptor subunit [Desulfovibrio sp. JC010]
MRRRHSLKNNELEFLPDSVKIRERRVPLAARFSLFTILGLIAFGITWACIGRVDKVVIAKGKVVTSDRPVVIQPIQTAIIRTMNVKEGDVVEAGQVLATLDPTFSSADEAEIVSREEYLLALSERVEAELEGRSIEAAASPLVQGQVRLMAIRMEQQKFRLESLDNEIDTLERKVEAAEAEQDRLRLSRKSLREIEETYKGLFEKKMCSKLEYLKAREDRRELSRQVAAAGASAAQLVEQLEKARAQRVSQEKDYRAELTKALVEARQELNELRHRLVKAERIRELVEIRAPRRAVVKETAQLAAGSIAREAEPLMVLAPLGSTLEADVEINARDIGRVYKGVPVRIKLEALPFQRYGILLGSVAVISPDAFLEQSGEGGEKVVYRAKVKIGQSELRNVPENFNLIPGMQLAAEMQVGQRRLITYFLDPIIRGFDESFREG